MTAQRVLDRAQALRDLVPAAGVLSLSDADLLRVIDAIGDERRALEAVAVEATAELDSRGLAAGLGYRGAPDAVAERAGIPVDEARAWCAVGAATAVRFSMAGEVLPPECPAIAGALGDLSIGVADAALIVRVLKQVVPFTDQARLHEVEQTLVALAPGLTHRDLTIAARRAVAYLDPDGVEPREDLLRSRSGVRVYRTADGLVRWSVTMHPEAAAFLTTAIDARTAPRREPRFGRVTDLAEPDLAEPNLTAEPLRPLSERRMDALVAMACESLQHDPGLVAGTPVTVSVIMTLDALLSGIGAAEIGGVDEPISAATARRLASDAEIIPIVLGGSSEPLDQGRAVRLFTSGQRRAMAVRDGGCVWPACNAPPGWCEAAHLRSWLDGGPTNLANGVLLCAFHHRRLDHDGWEFHRSDGVLWLIPPRHVDSERIPRRAGRLPTAA